MVMTGYLRIAALCAAMLGGVAAQAAPSGMDRVPAKPRDQVTLMNFRVQPYNHWAFRNIGINPVLMVPRGGAVSELPEARDERIGRIAFKDGGRRYTVLQALKRDGTDGVIVVQGGKIRYEAYFNGLGPDDQHIWASCTKSLIGLAMGILVEQGKVNLDKKASDYIHELRGSYLGARTVREILDMVTALDYSEDYRTMKPGEINTEYFRRLGFVPAFDLMQLDPLKSDTPRGILGLLPKMKGDSRLRPGTVFQYQSPNVDVAGWIIARVSGMPVHRFIAAHVWKKIGAEHDAYFMTDVNFNAAATGGFNTTLRDFARVGLAVLHDGRWNGQQIFPRPWVRATFRLNAQDRQRMARSVYKDRNGKVFDPRLEGYKHYLWVHDSEKGIGTFRGVYGQFLYINRDKDLVIATFSAAASASNAARASNRPRMAAFDAIAGHFSGHAHGQ